MFSDRECHPISSWRCSSLILRGLIYFPIVDGLQLFLFLKNDRRSADRSQLLLHIRSNVSASFGVILGSASEYSAFNIIVRLLQYFFFREKVLMIISLNISWILWPVLAETYQQSMPKAYWNSWIGLCAGTSL